MRHTPFRARGEPMVWLMAMAVIICLALILGTAGLILVRGGVTFWPGPIDEVVLRDGTRFFGISRSDEVYRPGEGESKEIEQARDNGTAFIDGAFNEAGQPVRRRYVVGNKDLGQESTRWVPLWQVESISKPENAYYIERLEWGPFLGRIEALKTTTEVNEVVETPVDVGSDSGLELLRDALEKMKQRRAKIEQIDLHEIPDLAAKMRELGYRLKEAELRNKQADEPRWKPLPPAYWWIAVFVSGFGIIGLALLRRNTLRTGSTPDSAGAWQRLVRVAVVLSLCMSLLYVVLERPWGHGGISDAELAKIKAAINDDFAEAQARQDAFVADLKQLRDDDGRFRVVVRDPGGRISPEERSERDVPMRVSQITRLVPANELGWVGRCKVYFARWWEFLSVYPRDAMAAGGVFPVIVGTVTLTLLLTVSVVPLGVIAALYLREYAHQGWITSIIRIAINNLAGVPSIVYGMFGLGFFCYALGGYIDGGPQHPQSPPFWWLMIGVLALLVLVAVAMSIWARSVKDEQKSRRRRGAMIFGGLLWVLAIVVSFWIIATTPYFGGFFGYKLPEQSTFGGRGILWASLTLALLTLPVVIVATEEAIAAVPGSTREGSYGCGASKWQTVRRIVLPSAMPGILTGAILAMARGAGEVAPLMLVGAVTLAPALPVGTEFPFLHGERTFMHLGFHIYTLGFQSPDSVATEPLVWTTTLLLITIVLLLNLIAIWIRARLRERVKTSAV